MIRRLAAIAGVLCLPLSAAADVEWAEWSGYPGPTRTGTFSRGYTVTLTPKEPTSFLGSGSVAAGASFKAANAVLGMDSTDNPPFQGFLSGSAPGALVGPGDKVVEIDLSDLPAGARPVFGIADQKFTYQLVLWDDAKQPKSQAGIVETPYNIQYKPSVDHPAGLVADQNTTLFDGKLYRDYVNDADPTDYYNQTGLTVYSELPAGTRWIRLLGEGTTESEGLSLFVGADFGATVEITDTSGASTDQSVSFGTVTVGAVSVTHTVTLTNSTDAAVTVGVSPSGLAETEFAISDECSGTLEASSSCTVKVAFHPTADGAVAGSLDVDANGNGLGSVAVSGTGTLEKTGDTNGDGTLSIADALMALRIAVGLLPGSPGILAGCDMNGDGMMTIADALAILRKSVGL